MKKSFRKGRLVVSLDQSQVFPDDPGNGTPAMIHCFGYHATYWCGCEEGLTDSKGNHLDLTPNEVEWLEQLDPEINDFLYPRSK